MAAGIRSSNLPLGTLIEVVGHADAGGGQRTLVRTPLDALADALRGIVVSDPSDVASLSTVVTRLSAALDDLYKVVSPIAVNVGTLSTDARNLSDAVDKLQAQAQADSHNIYPAIATLQEQVEGAAGLIQAVTDIVADTADQQDKVTALLTAFAAVTAGAAPGETPALYRLILDLTAHRYDYVRGTGRPGDAPDRYTLAVGFPALGGAGAAFPPLPDRLLAFGDAGSVVRLRGSGIIATRQAFPVEPGRAYAARFAYQRRANPSDPSNDSVRCLLVWLDQTGNPLSTPTVVNDDQALITASGRQEVGVSFARSAGAGLLVAPAAACYVRLAIQCFGPDGLTDIEVIDRIDTTEATLLDPVSASVASRVGALESQNPGQRLTAIEAQLGTPNSIAFPTKSDAQSGTIPGTVTTVVLLGRVSAGDGYEGRFKRVSGSAPAGSDSFTNAGQTWVRIAPAGEIALLGVQAAAQSLMAMGDSQPTASGTLYLNGQNLAINP